MCSTECALDPPACLDGRSFRTVDAVCNFGGVDTRWPSTAGPIPIRILSPPDPSLKARTHARARRRPAALPEVCVDRRHCDAVPRRPGGVVSLPPLQAHVV